VDPHPTKAPIDVIAQSAFYLLGEDDGGLVLWSVTESDDPIAVFPKTDIGRTRALASFRAETRFARWWRWCLATATVSAVVWIVSELASQLFQIVGVSTLNPFSGDTTAPLSWRIHAWVGAVSAVGYAVFLVSVGLGVLLWLQRRYLREGWTI
jgi:hypothetical protein